MINQIQIDLTNLIDVQLRSFQKFLKQGLILEIEKYKYIASSNFELLLDVRRLKYKKPLLTVDFCISNKRTYSIPIYIPVKVKFKGKLISNKFIYWGDLPLLTDKGCFIINGNFRVMVNQIVRSPGVYYERLVEGGFFATIVPSRGSWITLKMDF